MGNVSTGTEFAGMHHLELAFLDDVAPKYLSLARPPHGLKIRQWKNRSAVPLINKLHAGLSGLKRQQATVLDHKLVWLEGGNPEGSPVVLLHGFASNKENWLSLVPFLLKQHRLFVLICRAGVKASSMQTCPMGWMTKWPVLLPGLKTMCLAKPMWWVTPWVAWCRLCWQAGMRI